MKQKLQILIVLLSYLGASCGWAACSMSITGVSFGYYDVFSAVNSESIGTISVSCDTKSAFAITASTGVSGNYAVRNMIHNSSLLTYNLYTNAGMTRVFGDGTANTDFFSVNNSRGRSFTVYGRMPAQQNVYAGIYVDNLIVSLYF